MTPRSILPVAALGAAAGLFVAVHSSAFAAAAASPTPEQIFECYGWVAGQESRLAAFGLTDAELAAYLRGLTAAANDDAPPASFDHVRAVAEEFLNARVAEVKERRLNANRAEEEKFLAQLDRNPAVKKTDSGLRYEILLPGAAARATLKDTVVAHYTGSFPDGTVFDERAESGEPAEFRLMGVVPGWQEGLQLIGPGGRIKLYVPSKLGFGDFGNEGVPPAKALVFEIQLIAIKPGTTAAAPAPKPAP